ncbi:MAG: hypothetical protein HOV77_26715 [Hamadaea sp.]|uniref:hypothetical protein n=1 Tax=Hamadaea sp. TaxID=2024425 RepID=UPI001801BADC|nr:hypothetical protein [Hamadaea sp.]NUT22776.1 hypothetical protein [Hamadaea sp.]
MISRTRIVTFALAGAILFSLASGVAIAWFDAHDPDGVTVVVLVFGSYGLVLLAALAGIVANIAFLASPRFHRHPRFTVRRGAFWVPPVADMRLNGLMGVLFAGPLLGTMWNSLDDYGLAIAYAVFAILLGAATVAIGPGPTFELRPTGIYWNARIFYRFISWEALAPGGPNRPRLSDTRLTLITTRPELVRQRGVRLGSGTPERPILPLSMNVHPVFLADAIHWYADHPADRAAIGTAAEYDRLLAALGVRPAPATV